MKSPLTSLHTTAGLAELEGKLELWRSLFDKGVEGAGCPPSLQHNTQIIAAQWRELFESVSDCKKMLKSAHENVTQVHHVIQTNQSEYSIHITWYKLTNQILVFISRDKN